ncbi:MAG TPA: GTP-binding protein [Noviherbaspirillum sp.]|uniref:CobW family GTP-binding protein n=1 Tax=Noviherbaspirillum sp. TaxID=1926288 RepID=UPI002B49AAC8|nr:GTP-binding protein [Noviherbaspirillum sp.]HJV85400.1 GTP-binding protein [Noviherbaspirillum sp.]
MSKIPVTVITGFLGSGKTTLLNRALRSPRLKSTVVIVNEFGEIGLDHDLIETSSDSVILLPNGCLCCSVKGDLVITLTDLYQKRLRGEIPDFDHIVIETSGLAEPTPVMDVLLTHPGIKSAFVPAGTLATVDAVNGLHTLDNHEQSQKQIALASHIIITKADIQEPCVEFLARLQALNPVAVITDARSADVEALFRGAPEEWSDRSLGISLADTAAGAHASHRHNAHIKRFSVVRDHPWSLEMLRLFLDALATNAGPSLLRVKGIIHVQESPQYPAVVHGAQQLMHSLAWLSKWPSDDRRTRIVFITVNHDANEMRELIEYVERLSSRTRLVRQSCEKATAT